MLPIRGLGESKRYFDPGIVHTGICYRYGPTNLSLRTGTRPETSLAAGVGAGGGPPSMQAKLSPPPTYLPRKLLRQKLSQALVHPQGLPDGIRSRGKDVSTDGINAAAKTVGDLAEAPMTSVCQKIGPHAACPRLDKRPGVDYT